MKKTLNELRTLWQKDSEFYRTTEVGTGVQSFVKNIFESEIFNLKEGKLSTKLENRKNEFIYEKKAKESRKADFYIYINSEIAIPVEVECYGNIKAGETQLFNYQKDFDKHYGILTDGLTWRFYNNNIFKTFTLDNLLINTQLFPIFWKEYIKPEFYYLSFFEKVGQLALIEETKLRVENSRQLFFEDITKLIQSFKNKLQIEGYVEASDKKEKEKRAIELTYAYIIQFILYKTLVDNDFDNFANEFETVVIKIHESLGNRRYKDILGIIEGISTKISKNIYHPFIKEQDFIKDKIQDLYHSLENNLSDVSPWLDIFIFIKKYNFANVKNEIFGYIYENYLKELYDESKKGQYFTDPAVVNFMLEQIGYTPETVSKRYISDKDSISIIDPSCGSGTFLYSATNAIVKGFKNGSEETSKKIEEAVTNCIFGLDIEEFPLYLAEMSILMRMLPLIINEKYNNPVDKKIKVFKTRDSISEFLDTALRNTINDTNVEFGKNKGQISFFNMFEKKLNLGYSSYVRDEGDLNEMKNSLENHAEVSRKRFDYVIGNPPYISYNDSAKQKVLIFELMKQGKAKLNNIYGVNLHSTPNNSKKYRPNPNLYAFFIALGLSLLKDGGKLCYIIPQTVLINADLDVIRFHLAKYTTIEKIITFSGKMFLGRGLKQNKPVATSSLIFIVSRTIPSDPHEVEVINYSGIDEDIDSIFENIKQNKKTKKKKILQGHLVQSLANWNFIKLDSSFLEFHKEYLRNSEDFVDYYSHILATQKYHSNFIFDGGYSIDERKLLSQPKSGEKNYECPKLNNQYWSIKSNNGYWPNIREKSKEMFIQLRQGSQGYRFLDVQYKIIWSYNNTERFFYTDKQIIWARNKILGIASDNQKEIYYLFAVLNSKITRFLLSNFVKVANEDTRTILVSLQIIKDQVRTPIISEGNIHQKNTIVELVERLLNLEKVSLPDLVDFSGVLTQKFNKVDVDVEKLILKKDGEILKLPIKHDSSLVSKIIKANYNKEGIELDKQVIALSELQSLPIIDFDKQQEIKDQIDNLIFCLYFNIDIPKNKVSDAKFVYSQCLKNKYFEQISLQK